MPFNPAAYQSLTNLAAPAPAKNTYTDSGLSAAISVRNGWNSSFGDGSVISVRTLPPPAVKASLKPFTDSSPAAYFQVSVTAVPSLRSAIILPVPYPGCQLVNEVRKMFGAHKEPVMSSAPAFGTISVVPVWRATLAIASATPECTVPTTTSTLSRRTSRFMFSTRSEEHTSELQSPKDLVCRLLLEKKKK